MEKKLTIVVPVYKVEKYINKCLDSLILDDEGLMDQIEVIIVNDGTPDRSAEMSREYVKRFPNTFRQIDKENGGHGSAWNVGVKEARGKYIKFLDSDDWLENLNSIIEKLQDTDADLIITPYIVCDENTGETWKMAVSDMEFGRVYDADCFDWQNNSSEGHYYWHQGGIYRTEIMRRYQPLFLERQPYDDTILLVFPVIESKSLVAWDVPFYHYLLGREGQSVSDGMIRSKYNALINVRKSVIRFIEEHPIDQPSTKKSFLNDLLRKQYQFEYVAPIKSLPYREAKEVVKQWDKWVRQNNVSIVTKWMRLYRALPFFLYWIMYRLYCCLGRLNLRKKQ